MVFLRQSLIFVFVFLASCSSLCHSFYNVLFHLMMEQHDSSLTFSSKILEIFHFLTRFVIYVAFHIHHILQLFI